MEIEEIRLPPYFPLKLRKVTSNKTYSVEILKRISTQCTDVADGFFDCFDSNSIPNGVSLPMQNDSFIF
jgi:hypothetical protein